MKYLKDTHEILFDCTDRKVYAYSGIIGIAPNGDLTYGYDGTLLEFDENPLTQEEVNELADIMIGLWTRFKEHYV